MERNKIYLLAIFCLTVATGLGSEDPQAIVKSKRQHVAQISTKRDVPTAEQILGKLLGSKLKTPDQTNAPQPAVTAPQSLPFNPPPQLSTSQARSPLKTIFNNLPLIPSGRGATPQTEDAYNDGQQSLALPPPPPGYHYGSPHRKRPRGRYNDDDEYHKDDGIDDEEDDEEEDNPADEEYHDQRNTLGLGRRQGRGRGLGRNTGGRREGGCSCVCWKGIKPHVEWVRVPVCYKPCGVCCPKHEEQPACACICHPCCHCCHCCHCCCHHPCHCCHCCHCCRRSATWRPPLAPAKQNKPKARKQIKKKKKSKRKQ